MIHKVIKRVAIVHNAYGKVSGEEIAIDNLPALLEKRGVHVLRFSRASTEIEDKLSDKAAAQCWPTEEKFSLTDQIRRSSRSVGANLREAWSKRLYSAHFVSILTDCDGENSERATRLDFTFSCKYLASEDYERLSQMCKQVGAMLKNPKPFLLKTAE